MMSRGNYPLAEGNESWRAVCLPILSVLSADVDGTEAVFLMKLLYNDNAELIYTRLYLHRSCSGRMNLLTPQRQAKRKQRFTMGSEIPPKPHSGNLRSRLKRGTRNYVHTSNTYKIRDWALKPFVCNEKRISCSGKNDIDIKSISFTPGKMYNSRGLDLIRLFYVRQKEVTKLRWIYVFHTHILLH